MNEIIRPEEAKKKVWRLTGGISILALASLTWWLVQLLQGDGSMTVVIGAVLSGLILFFMAVGGLAAYMQLRRLKPLGDRPLPGEVLARWRYDMIFWQDFTASELSLMLRQGKWVSLAVFAAIPLLSLVAMFFGGENSSGILPGYITLMTGIGALCAALIWILFYAIGHVSYAQRIAGPAEVIIGKNFVRMAGADYEWEGFFNYSFRNVKLAEKQGRTVLTFYLHRGKNQQHVRIPVPEALRSEAERIIAYFGGKQE